MQKLVEVLHSQDVLQFMAEKYAGAVVPVY